jgi:Mn2+/Fe2+ NRAMP family transporter
LETSGQPWWFHRCLTKTDPATLFIIAIGLLFMAAVCMVIGVKLTSGVTLEQAINLQGVSEWSVPAQAERSITRNLLGISANAIGALCGLIGGLLPMWAVGRLIADAINSRSEP